ncbi:MAG: hypothetical protein IJ781_08205 [Atopobiaceae bacterium]|nr:hypothetical protein [Atopobiaceae bacterium]
MRTSVSKGFAATFTSLLLVAAMGLPGCGAQEQTTADEAPAEATETADEATEETAEDELVIDEDVQDAAIEATRMVLSADDGELTDDISEMDEVEDGKLDDLEVSDEVGDFDVEGAEKAAGMVAAATTGVGMMMPTYWNPNYDSKNDVVTFNSSKYDLAGYSATDKLTNFNGNVTTAAQQHVRAMVDAGTFDVAHIQDSGTLSTPSGSVVGSYVIFLAKRGSKECAAQTLYIRGRSKLSNVFVLFDLRDYDAANPDVNAAFESLGYSQGESM